MYLNVNSIVAENCVYKSCFTYTKILVGWKPDNFDISEPHILSKSHLIFCAPHIVADNQSAFECHYCGTGQLVYYLSLFHQRPIGLVWFFCNVIKTDHLEELLCFFMYTFLGSSENLSIQLLVWLLWILFRFCLISYDVFWVVKL